MELDSTGEPRNEKQRTFFKRVRMKEEKKQQDWKEVLVTYPELIAERKIKEYERYKEIIEAEAELKKTVFIIETEVEKDKNHEFYSEVKKELGMVKWREQEIRSRLKKSEQYKTLTQVVEDLKYTQFISETHTKKMERLHRVALAMENRN